MARAARVQVRARRRSPRPGESRVSPGEFASAASPRLGSRAVTGDVRIGLVGGGRLAQVGYLPAAARRPRRDARGGRRARSAAPRPGRRPRRGVPAFADATALLAGARRRRARAGHPGRHAPRRRRGRGGGRRPGAGREAAGARPGRGRARSPRSTRPRGSAFNRRFDPAVAAVRAAVPPGAEVGLRLEIGYRRRRLGAAHGGRRRAARPRPAPRRPGPLAHRRRGRRRPPGRR